jgi:starch synthase
MRVLFVTSEAYPLAKTGGLADVSRALPLALAERGIDARLLMPGYPEAITRIEKPRLAAKLDPVLGIEDATLIAGMLPGTDLPVWLIAAPSLYVRQGGLYQDADGNDWPDNALRFAFLAHVGAALAMGRARTVWKPDIVHANDWHAGLLPLLLSSEKTARPSTVFTTHNMSFQGNFPAEIHAAIGLPESYFSPDGVEFYGQISFLKAGLRYADRVTTVSPTYAKEILTPEFGCGMDGLLYRRGRDFSGILNGIDDALWDPSSDPYLPRTFRATDISGKRVCKAALQRELGLPVSAETPLIGFVSRLTQQKMADVILEALPWIAEQGAQFAMVGQGDGELEAGFAKAPVRFGETMAAYIGYDEPLAHRLQAGCDILLAPARFEPCGLTQLYALRYGSLPVVRRTGGLADTVIDSDPKSIAERTATGFAFDEPTLDAFTAALSRALALYQEPLTWRRLQLQAMAQDFSWSASAENYISLYRSASGLKLPQEPEIEIMQANESPQEIGRQIAG